MRSRRKLNRYNIELARSCARCVPAALAILCWGSISFAQAPHTTDWYARNTTRFESWRFFEPAAGGGDPTSTFIGNRLTAGGRRNMPAVEWHAGIQFVQLGWLPQRATGPGPLGLGAVYFDHAGVSGVVQRRPGSARTFAGDRLLFGFIESTVLF